MGITRLLSLRRRQGSVRPWATSLGLIRQFLIGGAQDSGSGPEDAECKSVWWHRAEPKQLCFGPVVLFRKAPSGVIYEIKLGFNSMGLTAFSSTTHMRLSRAENIRCEMQRSDHKNQCSKTCILQYCLFVRHSMGGLSSFVSKLIVGAGKCVRGPVGRTGGGSWR